MRLPPKPAKPRKRGLTSIIDYGPDNMGWTGPRGIADLLDCAADYIDFAKIYAMNALLMPPPTLRNIIGLYHDANVQCYSGGILFEHAHRRGEVPLLLDYLGGLGFRAMEISENYVTLANDERLRYFDACRKAGITVIYEFGRKNPDQAIRLDKLGALINEVLEAGVGHIIIEQSEITMTVRQDPDVLKELGKQPWFEHVLIEADTFDFPRHHLQLMEDFGRDVNLANVAPGQALRLEGLRSGIGRAVDYSLFKSA
ncbi:phosphosulfolactate synthase [Bordetella sp. H567]|nr:phosphosulfolactate synthase [Bordetella sp. H567]